MGPFPEMLCPEQFSPDRPRQNVFAGIRARALEAGEQAAGLE
jgi:hypothetical protein